MDKNMIHIDDLIKQRLGNGEEKERPGAWLQMRDLLDKEMPVSTPAVFNWRRMMGLVAGVGLLASVSVGGYYVSNSLRADEISDTAPVASVSSPGTNASSSNNNNDNHSTIAAPGVETDNKNGSTTQKITENKGNSTANTQSEKSSKSLISNKKDSYTATGKSNNDKASPAVATNNKKVQPTGAASAKTVAATKTNTVPATKEAATANVQKPSVVAVQDNKQVQPTEAAGSKTIAAANGKANLAATNTANPAANKPLVPNSAQGNNKNINNVTPPVVAQADNTRNLSIEKDSMNKMNVVQRWNRKDGFSRDTVSTGKMTVDKLVGNEPKQSPVPTAKNNATEKAEEVVPAAKLALAAKAESKEGELVPLEKYRVSRQKTGKTWDPVRFDEMVRDAKFKLSRIHFYPGVLVGGNSSFGQNNLSGFHAGLSGVITFNEKWSVLTELKYMHRFHGGNIEDDYLRSTDSSKVINGVRYYSYDSIEHYFNFPTVSTIELPIAIRYAIKRFQLFGGANLVYHFTINNIYEGDRLHSKETAMTSTVNYKWESGLPNITISDFSSRFGVGALLGAAYQMSPAMQLDIRMTKSIWDNASTPGAKEISRNLYMVPSLQMTLTYRLSGVRPGPAKAQ